MEESDVAKRFVALIQTKHRGRIADINFVTAKCT